MSDQDDPKTDPNTPSAQQDPSKTADPLDAAAKAAASNPTPKPAQSAGADPPADGTPSFTKEQMEWITQYTKSEVSKGINGYREKHAKDEESKLQKGEYMTREQFQAELALRDEQAANQVRAKEIMLTHLTAEGVTPGTKNYKTFFDAWEKLKADGAADTMLLKPEGVRAVMHIAGIGKAAARVQGDKPFEQSNRVRPIEPHDPTKAKPSTIRDYEVEMAMEAATKRLTGG